MSELDSDLCVVLYVCAISPVINEDNIPDKFDVECYRWTFAKKTNKHIHLYFIATQYL